MWDTGGSLRSLFIFSRQERWGIGILCTLVMLMAGLPHLSRYSRKSIPPILFTKVDSFAFAAGSGRIHKVIWENRRSNFGRNALSPIQPSRPASLFYFDPNNISFSEWERLGLPGRTIRVILHYREKGGTFRKPDDLGRIWGLDPGSFKRLRPFVRIEEISGQHDHHIDRTHVDHVFKESMKKVTKESIISDINQADSLSWLALPGIGEKLTSRILNFRDKLGGFCSVDQVGETWGLPDSTFRMIKPLLHLGNSLNRKIPINTATVDVLQQHPYIRYSLARLIIRYRQEHGPFSSVEDLRRIALVTDELYGKLEPYCITY
jgi:DNA uptake protein ComE-like DNA-binding protein